MYDLTRLHKALGHLHLHNHSSRVFAKLCDGSSVSMLLERGQVHAVGYTHADRNQTIVGERVGGRRRIALLRRAAGINHARHQRRVD